MLRVNVGLSRKVSKDYNSSGFSVNFDGEITAAVADAEAVIEQVKELFNLAEETLDREIERHQSDTALADRDAALTNSNGNGHNSHSNGNGAANRTPVAKMNGHARGNGASSADQSQQPEAATNKQINYLLSIGKRNRLSTLQLEQRIGELLGQQIGLYDLSKRDAAKVIDALTNNGEAAATSRR